MDEIIKFAPSELIFNATLELSGIDPNLKCHQITKEMRSNLVHLLKNLTLVATTAG